MAHADSTQRIRELEEDFQALLRNERALQAAGGSADLCERILKQAMAATGADAGSIFLKDAKTGSLVCTAAGGEKAPAVRHYSLTPGRGIVGAVYESGKPILTDARVDPRHDRGVAAQLGYPVSGMLAVPIADTQPGASGGVLGVLELLLHADTKSGFDDDDVRLLTLMAGQATRAIEAARAFDAHLVRERLDAMALVIRGVVHDVRNPLTFINGYAEMLSEDGKPTEARSKARDAIYRNVDDINEMLAELADFAAGDDSLRRKTADLREIVGDVVLLFQARAGTARVKLRFRNTRGEAPASVDVGKLRRAVSNLVKNAIEATPPGGRVTVTLVRRKKAGDYLLSVRDTGPGVPPEVMSRLFQPFVTRGKAGGTGLGLSITRRFAEAHGGEVGCRTRAGKGTRFVMRLPSKG